MTPGDAFVLAFLVNAAWQASLIAGLGGASLWLLRTAPALTRHRVAFCTTLFCAAVPIMAASLTILAPRYVPAPIPLAPAGPELMVPAAPVGGWSAAVWIARVYLCLVAVRLLGLLRGAVRMHRLRAESAPITSGAWHAEFEDCCGEWPVSGVSLRSSTRIRIPIVCGWRNAAIVLPASAPECTSQLARAIIGHELSHVHRGDVALNLVLELLTVPMVFHPAVAWMKRATSGYRELASDELALARLRLPRHRYARALVQVASWSVDPSCGALALGFGAGLERRVEAILDDQRTSFPGRAKSFMPLMCLAAVSVVAPLFAVSLGVLDRDALSGEWHLDPSVSRPAGAVPFSSLRMTIGLDGTRLQILQTRTVISGTTEQVTIEGQTDRTPFDVEMPDGEIVRAHAHWKGNRLIINSVFPGRIHTERDETFVRDGELVVVSRARGEWIGERTFEFVFRRSQSR